MQYFAIIKHISEQINEDLSFTQAFVRNKLKVNDFTVAIKK